MTVFVVFCSGLFVALVFIDQFMMCVCIFVTVSVPPYLQTQLIDSAGNRQ